MQATLLSNIMMIRRSPTIQNHFHPRLFCCAQQMQTISGWHVSSIPLEFLIPASGKSMIFQMRGLRHYKPGESSKKPEPDEDGEQASQSSRTEREFNINRDRLSFFQFIGSFVLQMNAALNYLLKLFGYKSEPIDPKMDLAQLGRTYLLASFGLQFILVLLLYILKRRRDQTRPEQHKAILRQPPVGFDQFMRDYLRAGEVKQIVHYPQENLALAVLNPDAMINGKQFTGPGVNIDLDYAFAMDPKLLTTRVREAEQQMGIGFGESVPIVVQKTPQGILYFVAFFPLVVFFLIMGRHFRLVPIVTKGKNMKK